MIAKTFILQRVEKSSRSWRSADSRTTGPQLATLAAPACSTSAPGRTHNCVLIADAP